MLYRLRQHHRRASPNYFSSEFAEAEWTAAFRLDPTGKNEKLIPVRLRRHGPMGVGRARARYPTRD